VELYQREQVLPFEVRHLGDVPPLNARSPLGGQHQIILAPASVIAA